MNWRDLPLLLWLSCVVGWALVVSFYCILAFFNGDHAIMLYFDTVGEHKIEFILSVYILVFPGLWIVFRRFLWR